MTTPFAVATPAERPKLVCEIPGMGSASVPVWGCADLPRAHAGLARAFTPERLATAAWFVRPER